MSSPGTGDWFAVILTESSAWPPSEGRSQVKGAVEEAWKAETRSGRECKQVQTRRRISGSIADLLYTHLYCIRRCCVFLHDALITILAHT